MLRILQVPNETTTKGTACQILTLVVGEKWTWPEEAQGFSITHVFCFIFMLELFEDAGRICIQDSSFAPPKPV